MQLDCIEAGLVRGVQQRIGRWFVYEDPDCRYRSILGFAFDVLNDLARSLRLNKAWTGAIEIKAQHVRAYFNRRPRVRKITNAADFYSHRSMCVMSLRLWANLCKIAESALGVGGSHQHLANQEAFVTDGSQLSNLYGVEPALANQ